MNYAIDHCDPFDEIQSNIWMKCEHCGRYLFAADFLINCFSDNNITLDDRKNKNEVRVLDAACAEGYGTMILERAGFEMIGLDVEETYLVHAQKRCKGTFFQVDFDCECLPVEDDTIDAVVCFETIEHLQNPEDFLSKLYHALSEDGFLLLSFPNSLFERFDENGNNKDYYHKRVFQKSEMIAILNNRGFTVLNIYGQALSNQIVSAERDAINAGRLNCEYEQNLFQYDEVSVMELSKLIGYPSQVSQDESYSYLFVCRKSKL